MTRKSVQVNGSITAPLGFRAAGIHAGIKQKNKKDMALIISDAPAAIAGMFTTNRVQAAPVRLCKKHLAGRVARAILVNSGNANACTGLQGTADAVATARLTAKLLYIRPQTVFVCSTGTIGVPMPMNIIRKGIRLAVSRLSRTGGPDAASAIITTDTRPKQVCHRLQIDGRTVTIAGIAKGAGMIAPHMATLLVFLTTDAPVKAESLHACLSAAVEQSFNRITVDGDESTNDTVLFMANAMAGGSPINPRHPGWKPFCSAVNNATRQLAMMIVRDGEGATKLVAVTVKGAPGRKSAEKVARAVACSSLVKTSWYGADPNWGRVICAVGYSGVDVQQDLIDIAYNDQQIVSRGRATQVGERVLHKIMSASEFSIEINLHLGKSSYTIYTCDCSEEYVRINASYMT